MLKLSEVTSEQARKTCLVVAAVLLLVSGWNFYRDNLKTAAIVGGITLALTVSGLFIPPIARRFHVVWMTIALALGYVNSRILLTLVFFLMFVPYGLISRLFGRDPLYRRGEKRESYWQPKKNTRQCKEQFERLF